MIVRAGTGWQTMLADLAMILFLITAQGLAKRPADARSSAPPLSPSPTATPSPRGEPMAVWIEAPGAPRLAEWLATQPRDSRQQVTLTAFYAPGGQSEALSRVSRLAAEAGAAGARARIVVEPGSGAPSAALAFDRSPALARGLLGTGPGPIGKKESP